MSETTQKPLTSDSSLAPIFFRIGNKGGDGWSCWLGTMYGGKKPYKKVILRLIQGFLKKS